MPKGIVKSRNEKIKYITKAERREKHLATLPENERNAIKQAMTRGQSNTKSSSRINTDHNKPVKVSKSPSQNIKEIKDRIIKQSLVPSSSKSKTRAVKAMPDQVQQVSAEAPKFKKPISATNKVLRGAKSKIDWRWQKGMPKPRPDTSKVSQTRGVSSKNKDLSWVKTDSYISNVKNQEYSEVGQVSDLSELDTEPLENKNNHTEVVKVKSTNEVEKKMLADDDPIEELETSHIVDWAIGKVINSLIFALEDVKDNDQISNSNETKNVIDIENDQIEIEDKTEEISTEIYNNEETEIKSLNDKLEYTINSNVTDSHQTTVTDESHDHRAYNLYNGEPIQNDSPTMYKIVGLMPVEPTEENSDLYNQEESVDTLKHKVNNSQAIHKS